jgi:hypothetical protein
MIMCAVSGVGAGVCGGVGIGGGGSGSGAGGVAVAVAAAVVRHTFRYCIFHRRDIAVLRLKSVRQHYIEVSMLLHYIEVSMLLLLSSPLPPSLLSPLSSISMPGGNGGS